MAGDWQQIASIARKRRADAIPKEYLLPSEKTTNLPRDITNLPSTSGHFTHDEVEIIESEAEDIVQKIQERIWTSVEVIKAFCKAATVAHQLASNTICTST